MAAIQSLKKQLRGIRSTQKLTKAMKTISTVKFSKLNTQYNDYAFFSEQCMALYAGHARTLAATFPAADPHAPAALVVLSSNKGLCGNFNSEILNFALEQLESLSNYRLVACGKKAIGYFNRRKIPIEKEWLFEDTPSFEDAVALLDCLLSWRQEGKISQILIIYPRYDHMMQQTPTLRELFETEERLEEWDALLLPDRQTILGNTSKTILRALFYRLILESALGAQAATMMTMRSAYDTATEYCSKLEGQINRLRQSAVTADVLETASERE